MPHWDLDYLSLSASLHARAGQLLDNARRDALIDAPTAADTLRLLAQSGYGEVSTADSAAVEKLLSRSRKALFDELSSAVPEKRIVAAFALKYDYHNAKALLKARQNGQDARHLLIDCGRYRAAALEEAFAKEDFRILSLPLRDGIERAAEVLSQSADAQQADLILDRACYGEMHQLAKASESPFFQNFVALLIDAANLRTAVRALRMGREKDFLLTALFDGGTLPKTALASAQSGSIAAMTAHSVFAEAGALASGVLSGGGSLTTFERECDNAVNHYLSAARRTPFGEEVVIGYLYAKEAEYVAIRTIVSGKIAGLAPDTIRERLRDTYL